MFILDEESGRIKEKNITYTPGLYKIYDEILVNAADNKQRDPSMNNLEIIIDAEENVISVKNNGKGIPVVMHKEHNCYVPTLIFGKISILCQSSKLFRQKIFHSLHTIFIFFNFNFNF